jgi:hypothetical protein
MDKRPEITIQDVYLGPLIYEKIQKEKNLNNKNEKINDDKKKIPSNIIIERGEIQYKEKLSENLIPTIVRNNKNNNNI